MFLFEKYVPSYKKVGLKVETKNGLSDSNDNLLSDQPHITKRRLKPCHDEKKNHRCRHTKRRTAPAIRPTADLGPSMGRIEAKERAGVVDRRQATYEDQQRDGCNEEGHIELYLDGFEGLLEGETQRVAEEEEDDQQYEEDWIWEG
ncbi:hypothetical protein QJS10_CPA01g02373 [Acorus calamus]|uniref:Uncharacterized protein n=1 Tax=Acorus calamus TaxID=4465 RepID=A0AAV9FLU5_ACOCL|nr:hypothetical protein QJS10_CPA01g02373 [Acorus calamus]